MRKLVAPIALAAALALAGPGRAAPALVLDHAWIAVSPDAPERAVLERAGFRIASTVNRHQGQGTASITVEFVNGFLELLWPDDTVPVAPALAAARQKFVAKMNWRTSGASPFAVGLRRTPDTPATFPFETWKVTADWMGPGRSMEMLTPRASSALSLFISPNGVDETDNAVAIARGGPGAAMYLHPNGARRLTAIRVTAPNAEGLPPSAAYVRATGAVGLKVGRAWRMDVTLDDGRQKKTADLRPDLPMVIHY